jgi:hypothetical protein
MLITLIQLENIFIKYPIHSVYLAMVLYVSSLVIV